MMSLSSEGQCLSANQISSTYLTPRLRYNYFRFGKTTVRHIKILLPVSILITSPYSACQSALGCRISSKLVHPRRRYNVISISKMAAAAAQFYFRFQIGWHRSFSDVSFYQQTKFRSYNSMRGWDITISVFEKQVSAILEFYFRFRFQPNHRSRHVILHHSEKFYPNLTARGRKWRHVDFQDDGSLPSWILRVQ